MKKYYLFYYLLLIFSFGLLLFMYLHYRQFSSPGKVESAENNQNSYSISELASDLYNGLVSKFSKVNSYSDIGKQYCIVISNKLKTKRLIFKKGDITIDPKCSIWLNLFCKKYLSGYINDSLPVVENINFGYKDDLQRSRAIFNILMNDYFNSKVLSIYSYDLNGDIQTAIKRFSDKYFGNGSDICGSSSLFYLYPEEKKPQSLTDKQSVCSHPMTYNYVKNTIKSLFLIKSRLKILDYDKLVNMKECNFSSGFKPTTKSDSTDMTIFYNILQNEYFWYSLYLNTYKFLLLYKNGSITYSGKIYLNPSLSYLNSINNKQILQIDTDLQKTYEAINLSIRILTNLEWAWPIHVALVAYYEDILRFRKELIRIYTPFHQLYYKLRNVEDLDR